jgi:hypothetical protein
MRRSVRRAAVAGLGLVSLALAGVFASGIAAELYGRIAAEHRSKGIFTLAGVSAARQAANLQPWRPASRAEVGWMMGLRGDLRPLHKQYRRALRLAPASAYLWLEYAEALARSYQLDNDYTVAVERATTLAPSARPVQVAAARMGSRHWNQGDEKVRAVWARNMSHVLATTPYDLLWPVVRDRREDVLCGFVGAELGLARWCFAVSAARTLCDTVETDAPGVAAEQCRRLGLNLPATDADDDDVP